jgi:hypothetical protein
MDNLAANPSGSSSIYGQPATPSNQDMLSVVNRLKDRNMQDFKEKANFMSDLSLKQDRLKRIYDTYQVNPLDEFRQSSQGPNGAQQPMNTVMAKDPNALTGYQKGELGIRQQGVDLESQRLAQAGKFGQGALDIKDAAQKLNQQKNDQINALKTADMQRKIDEANQKIQLATNALQQKSDSAEASLQAHKDLAAAVEERHKLEMIQKQNQFDMISSQHQQTIDALNKRLKQQSHQSTTTSVNPDGSQKTVTTDRGGDPNAPTQNPDGTYSVTAPDGTKGTIPADKLNDWMQNHHPGGNDNQDQGGQ